MNKIYLPKSGMQDLETIIKESWELKVRLNQLSLDERKIIVLSGDYGVGKDVWASLIHAKNPNFEIVRFADPLREAFERAGIPCHTLDLLKRTPYVFPRYIVDGYNLNGMTTREALIHVAETNKQKFGQDYYAKQAIQKAREILDSGKLVIFTDLRFDVENSEVLALAKKRGLLVERLHIPTSLPKIEVI